MSPQPQIAIIDYGMGNLRSVQKGLERAGYPARVTRDAAIIRNARGVILPGVGAFGACMENLYRCGLTDTVRQVIADGTPFLGICVGMQILFEESEEFGRVPGLGIFPGRVFRFPDTPRLTVPHMGWNQIRKRRAPVHLEGIDDETFVYFVHSFYVVPADPALTATTTEYGVGFASSIERDNVFATQFHPEKSQAAGLRILENFGRVVTGTGRNAETCPGASSPLR